MAGKMGLASCFIRESVENPDGMTMFDGVLYIMANNCVSDG